MANQYVNKVIYGGTTLIDISEDTVTAADVINSKYFHLKSGQRVQGTCTYNVNARDATASASEILATKTAYVGSSKVTGEMVNNGAVTGYISDKNTPYTIGIGYHDGSGTVSIAAAEQAKLIASNIREGVTILGVLGTMSGSEAVVAVAPTVTPYTTSKTYVPSDFDDASHEYNYISQVTVSAIARSDTDNAAGGVTVTIGTVDPDA